GRNGVYTVSGFQQADIPAVADYAGNGSDQPVVFRPGTGQFLRPNGTVITTFGQSGDIPLTAPLSYRLPSGSTTPTPTPTLSSIVVTPANPSVPKQLTRQFTATGTYSDN